MKTIPTPLANHLQNNITSVATCWKVTLQGSPPVILGFTDHDQDIAFGGITYLASSGFLPTAVENQTRLAVDNLQSNGFLDSETIKEQDLLNGVWDYADIEIFQVNWKDPTQGREVLITGHLGEIKIERGKFETELRGLANAFTQTRNKLYQPLCRASFGDAECGVNLSAYTVSGTITSVSADGLEVFDSARTESEDYFRGGKITMTSGESAGLSMEIKQSSPGSLTLQLSFPQGIAAGDTYSAHAGCSKRFAEDCVAKYANGVNFRGHPHLPGINRVLQYGWR